MTFHHSFPCFNSILNKLHSLIMPIGQFNGTKIKANETEILINDFFLFSIFCLFDVTARVGTQ